MDNNGMSLRESFFMFAMIMAIGGFLACSLALHALAAQLPYIILALAGAGCLIAFTGAKCYAMISDARARRHYLDSQSSYYLDAGCREVDRPRRNWLSLRK